MQINYDELNKAIGLNQGNVDTSSLGGIIGSFLPYILVAAGLVLFIMLIAGGFNLLTGAASQESQEKGKQQITSALIGFIIVFASYWVAQILQIIFKVEILG